MHTPNVNGYASRHPMEEFARKFYLLPSPPAEGETETSLLPVKLEALCPSDAIREVKKKGLRGTLCIEICDF